jgi:phosphoserine/homoserine phosphotransferase
MLAAANAGFWFHAPDSITAQFPQFPATHSYDELFDAITGALDAG